MIWQEGSLGRDTALPLCRYTDGRVAALFLLSFICKESIQSFLPPSPLHSHLHILKHCPFQTKVLSQTRQAPGRFREITERDTTLPVICWRRGRTLWGSDWWTSLGWTPLGKSSSFTGKENGHHLVLSRCKGRLWGCGCEWACVGWLTFTKEKERPQSVSTSVPETRKEASDNLKTNEFQVLPSQRFS